MYTLTSVTRTRLQALCGFAYMHCFMFNRHAYEYKVVLIDGGWQRWDSNPRPLLDLGNYVILSVNLILGHTFIVLIRFLVNQSEVQNNCLQLKI